MKGNKHYIRWSVNGSTHIDIDETPPRADKDKRPIEELLEKKQRNRILELIIASFGVIIGVVLGLWILIEIVMLGISK